MKNIDTTIAPLTNVCLAFFSVFGTSKDVSLFGCEWSMKIIDTTASLTNGCLALFSLFRESIGLSLF
jgi:hypothetical protein